MARKDVTDEIICKFADEAAGGFLTDKLVAVTGEPRKVVCQALERAYDHGLIKYGVSLRTAWLTDKGRAFLKEKKEVIKLRT